MLSTEYKIRYKMKIRKFIDTFGLKFYTMMHSLSAAQIEQSEVQGCPTTQFTLLSHFSLGLSNCWIVWDTSEQGHMMVYMSDVNSQWRIQKQVFLYINNFERKGTHISFSILITLSGKRTVSTSPVLQMEEGSWLKCSVNHSNDNWINNDGKINK